MEHGRQVICGDIESDLVEADLPGDILRDGIAQGDILDASVCTVEKIESTGSVYVARIGGDHWILDLCIDLIGVVSAPMAVEQDLRAGVGGIEIRL